MAEKSTEDQRDVAEYIDNLTFEQMLEGYTTNQVSENSALAKRLLNHANPDPSWVRFAHEMGRFELAIGDTTNDMTVRIDTALHLLMVLTGAQDQMQLMQISRKLKRLEDRLPSIAKQVFTGFLGGQMAQNASPTPVFLPPASEDGDSESPSPTAVAYELYPFNSLAISTPARTPVVNGAIALKPDGANLAGIGEPVIGVAVDVDTGNKIVKVAINGQKIASLPPSFMAGLAIGDELIATLTTVNGRYLCTTAEAVLVGGYSVGQPCRVVAQVLHSDAGERSIVVVSNAAIPLPAP